MYLTSWATGLSNANTVSPTVDGLDANVFYRAASGAAGLDQVNIGPLPRTLAGRVRVKIVLAADGQSANPIQIAVPLTRRLAL